MYILKMNWLLKIFLFFLYYSILFGQKSGQWTLCSGDAAIENITNEEAQVIAKRRARLDAIEKVCGVSLHAETLVKDFIAAGDFIHALSYGRVVEEKDIQWKLESQQSPKPGVAPTAVLHVDMMAMVLPDSGKPDPSFKVNLKMNRTTYQSGDEVILTVKSTKDCFLTVLNLGADDTVRVLFPNKWQENSFVSANKNIEIPDKIYRESRVNRVSIHVTNLPGHKKDSEIIKVIATKQNMNILDETDCGSGFGLIGTPKMAMTKLARWLSEIPISDRAEYTSMYTVQSE